MTVPSFVVGIAGGTGAGKTAIAEAVTEAVGDAVARVPLDSYYRDLSHLDVAEREAVNYDHPSAFEWELVREHLEQLLEGAAVEMPQYDFTVHNRTDETVRVDPAEVVVVEGIFALYDDSVVDMQDLRLYVQTDADVRILRRIRRDVIDRGRDLEGVIDQYLSTVKPMHEQFVAPTRKRADVVVPEGANSVALNVLSEKIQAEIRGDAVRRWERAELESRLRDSQPAEIDEDLLHERELDPDR